MVTVNIYIYYVNCNPNFGTPCIYIYIHAYKYDGEKLPSTHSVVYHT